ncbi:hypothetical protein [Actinoplanes sp. NPDC051411]|uniref:hypothetical protein n=1 Tax=Actinoplanes sp. NPDC051411 TaxID=3155522 RepID=UPI0034178394
MTEDRRDRPSRGWLGDASSPEPRSGYPEWPPSSDATPDDAAPTNVYAALSDLAPYDAAPAEPEPAHGQPVPRDFAPPQSPWTTASDIGGSRVRLTPGPPPLDPADLDAGPHEPQGMYGHPPADPATTYAQAPSRPADPYGRPGTEPQGLYGDSEAGAYGRPGAYPPGFSSDATDPGAGPAETYGGGAARSPGHTYGRPPAHSSDPTETFDRAWATRAGGSAAHDDPAAGYGDRGADHDRADQAGPAAGFGEQGPGFGERPQAGSGYDDRADLGYAGPAGSFGDQSRGYGERDDAGYGRADGDYAGPAAGFGDRGPAFGDRAEADFAGPAASLGDRGPAYGDPAEADFAGPAGSFGGQDAGYGGPAVGYGDRPVAGRGEPGPGYGVPDAGHGGPGAGYEGPAPGRDERAWAAADGPAAGGMYDGPPRVEWVAADETAVADGAVIDLSVPRGVPVNHRGRNRRRRGIVVAAALGAVLAGGAGYAGVRGLGLDGGTTHKNAEVPLVTIAPTTDPALPDDSPSIGIPDSASASAAKTASASPSVSATATTPATHATTTGAPGDSGVVVIPTPTPAKTNSPHVVRPSVPASTGSSGLTARFKQVSDADGIVGSVTVTNPGSASAGWTVQVTVPGATQVVVTTTGVAGHIAGDVLTFSGPSIAAGDALTFSFVASGPLSGSASGCSVNGDACS